ncbi:MAG: glycosyl hydrolase family 32 [Verrucomicrobiota bacterium JB024]|nr:glycosyl hydrolase family 32 [Verrucomicrobiota bacterium JB024]
MQIKHIKSDETLDNHVSGEVLYNGIVLPQEWPPRNLTISPELAPHELNVAYGVDDPHEISAPRAPLPVPYLAAPPSVISIDVGRQLFVDDFLIEQTDLGRCFHKAVKCPDNPIFYAETPLEKPIGRLAGAAPKSGGLWWDPRSLEFKLWYESGWCEALAYATSPDGLHWNRPCINPETGDNQLKLDVLPDSSTVFLDHATNDPGQRFKMFVRSPGHWEAGIAFVSVDGIHWTTPTPSGTSADRSTIFYNPFRKKWVYSIRSLAYGRTRHYHEHEDFLTGVKWEDDEPVFWASADDLDLPDPEIGYPAQLYNVDAVAYESIMVGLFEILRGPNNAECANDGRPKITDLSLAYSRDGFHWDRPDRSSLIACEQTVGSWDRGYVQSVGGLFTVVGDELWFYYSAAQGGCKDTDPEGGMYANRSMGIARLRRDGFASMQASEKGGTLTTRPLRFSGTHLWVNLDCPEGALQVEVLNPAGEIIEGFSKSDSKITRGDHTKVKVSWGNDADLAPLANQPVRFKFYLTNGHLYSFWVSASVTGCSGGYVAAGGPGFWGGMDTD